ncbi:MAG: Gfo/Idh/MocA family oxidoreductase [Candidatus Thorarchaeota archaeon]|nr:MAG: Gfo/Idh/MocA family oxidoreductase [Candidatus Thorarchaeota archaeon]
MSEDAELRLGIIGTGNIGRAHLAALSSLKRANLANFQLSAVCDVDSKSARKAAKDFDIPKMYEKYNDLINNDEIDVVYVCTPTSRHTDIVKAAAKAGKAVYCEEPIANSATQARTLMGVIQDAGVPSGAGFLLRFDPFVLYAKDLLEHHDFGRPMLAHIRADHLYTKGYERMNEWRGDSQIPGGGTLIEHCDHDVDLLTWFFGPITDVHAKIRFIAERGVEDLASLMLTHKDGQMSTLDSIWHSIDRLDERRIEFFYEKGFIGITLETGIKYLKYHVKGEGPVRVNAETADNALLEHLGVSSSSGSLESYGVLRDTTDNRYAAMSYAFLKAVKSGKNPSPNFMDAVSAHSIIDAAYESATKGTTIEIF